MNTTLAELEHAVATMGPAEQHALAEDILAQHGFAVVSVTTALLIERSEAGGTLSEIEWRAVMYDIYSGPYGEFWPRKVFA